MKKFICILLLLLSLPISVWASSASVSMGDSTCPSGKRCRYTYLTVQDAIMPAGGTCGDGVTACTLDATCSPEVCEDNGCQKEDLEDSTGVLRRIRCPYLEGTTSAGSRTVWFKLDLRNYYEDLNHDLQFFMETDISSGRVCLALYARVVKTGVADWDSQVDYQIDAQNVTFTFGDSRQVDFANFAIIEDLINTHCPTAECKDVSFYIGIQRIMDKTGSLCSTGAPGQSIGNLYIYPGRVQHPFTP